MRHTIGTIYVDIDPGWQGDTHLFVEYGQEGGYQVSGPAQLKEELQSQPAGGNIITTLQRFFSQKCCMSISRNE